jgi:hypothetical protein
LLQLSACAVGVYMVADAVAAVPRAIMAIIANKVIDLIKLDTNSLI